MGVWHMGQIASAMRLSTDRIGLRAPLWGTLTVLRTGLCHMDGCGARCQARMGQSDGLRRGIWHKSSSGQQEAHAKSVGWVTGAQGTRNSINHGPPAHRMAYHHRLRPDFSPFQAHRIDR